MWWLLFVPDANAGVVLGATGSFAVALKGETSSDRITGEPGFLVGYRIDGGSLRWQPELVARLNFGAPALPVSGGFSVVGGDRLEVGGYLHAGSHLVGYWILPSVDTGIHVGLRRTDPFYVAARAGWEWVQPWRNKGCLEACAQPAQHWAALGLVVGAHLGRRDRRPLDRNPIP